MGKNSKKKEARREELRKELERYGNEILNSEEMQQAFKQRHHTLSTVGAHTMRVAATSLAICHALKKLKVETDIPAVALIIISVAAFLKLSEGGRSPFWAFICGAAAAGAYSARQVYLIYLIAIIVVAIIQILFAKEKMIKGEQKGKILLKLRARLARFQDKYGYFVAAGKKAIKIAILLFSVVLVMIPQVMINERYYETSDWQPQTDLYTAGIAETRRPTGSRRPRFTPRA